MLIFYYTNLKKKSFCIVFLKIYYTFEQFCIVLIKNYYTKGQNRNLKIYNYEKNFTKLTDNTNYSIHN